MIYNINNIFCIIIKITNPSFWDFNFFDDSPVEEFPDLYMSKLFENLLHSENMEVVFGVLDILERVFHENTAAVNTFGYSFLVHYCNEPTEDPQLNLRTIQVLTSMFSNGMNVWTKPINGPGYDLFLQIRGIIESIITDPESSDELLSAVIDCITALLEQRPSSMHALDIFKDTSIVETMISRSAYCQFKARKSIINSLCKILEYSTKNERKELIKLGIVGVLCEFANSLDSENIIEMRVVLETIKILIMDISVSSLSDEEFQQIDSIRTTLEEISESSENYDIKFLADKLLSLIEDLFAKPEE